MAKTYQARELAGLSRDALWAIPDGEITLVFDDGKLKCSARAAIYSAYMWKIHTLYPKTPLLKRHHIGDTRLKSSTHLDLLGKVMWDCYDAYQGEVDIEELSKLVYQSTNELYNDTTYRLEAYVSTLSVLDFIDVVTHPVIEKANDEVKPNRASIEHTYATIRRVLKDPKELIGNPVAEAARNGLVDMIQICQCVGPRGAVTDIDSNFFKDPILTGFVEGMRKLQDSMMESRSASKSLMFTEKPLQDSEYFNRQLQLLCGTFEHMHYAVNDTVAQAGHGEDRVYLGNCGSTHYMPWFVKAEDLPILAGKYYQTKQGLERIRETDRHLIGKDLKLRSVLYCVHPDPRGVCATCFGELSLSVPRDTCLGHVSATALCEKASQSVLSVKHVDFAAGSQEIEFSDYEAEFLEAGSEGNTIVLSDNLKGKKLTLSIDSKDAEKLSDILFVEDVRQLPPPRISELSEMLLTIHLANGKDEQVPLCVSNGSRKASFTHDLLEHIKEKNWTLSETGRYGIDLTGWDLDLPILELPRKHENMLDYLATIDRFISSSVSSKIKQKTLKDCHSIEEALYEFNTLVQSRLVVNIAHLEVILKALMIRSLKEHDFRLPHVGNDVLFGKFDQIMEMRSMSVAMAYQGHKKALLNPANYVYTKRPSHPLDPLLEPASK